MRDVPTLCTVKGGCMCLNPPSGGLLQEVINFKNDALSSVLKDERAFHNSPIA